jgi:hypothetical protein
VLLKSLTGSDVTQSRILTSTLADWRGFWESPTDRDSVQANVTFAGERLFTPGQLNRVGLPWHFAIADINGRPATLPRGIGCDVTKLPIPPPISSEPFGVPDAEKPEKK